MQSFDDIQGLRQVPFYAATLARARLQRMHERLVDTGGERVSEYLSGLNARSLLFLKLLAQVRLAARPACFDYAFEPA